MKRLGATFGKNLNFGIRSDRGKNFLVYELVEDRSLSKDVSQESTEWKNVVDF